jgi:hypothetical protein
MRTGSLEALERHVDDIPGILVGVDLARALEVTVGDYVLLTTPRETLLSARITNRHRTGTLAATSSGGKSTVRDHPVGLSRRTLPCVRRRIRIEECRVDDTEESLNIARLHVESRDVAGDESPHARSTSACRSRSAANPPGCAAYCASYAASSHAPLRTLNMSAGGMSPFAMLTRVTFIK